MKNVYGNSNKVTVIVPIYNVAKYLDRCLESVSRQTYSNLEILLMVKESEDNSLDICLSWMKRDDRMILVLRKESDLGNARNTAVRMATGEYICCVDSDDYIDKSYVEKLVYPLMNDASIDMSCCGYDRVFGKGDAAEGWIPSKAGRFECDYKKYIASEIDVYAWLKMFRTEFLRKNGLFSYEHTFEDVSLKIMIACVVRSYWMVSEPLYHYTYDNSNSIMHGNRGDIWNNLLESFKYGYDFSKNYPEAMEGHAYTRKYFIWLMKLWLETDSPDKGILEKIAETTEYMFPEILKEDNAKGRDKKFTDRIVLFGAGDDGRDFLIRRNQGNIDAVIDNNPSIQGKKFENVPVISVAEYKERYYNDQVVIASSRYFYDMAEQLRCASCNNYVDVYDYEIELLKSQITPGKKNIYLMVTPEHRNVGDYAIKYAQLRFLRKHFPDFNIIEVTEYVLEQCRLQLRSLIKKDDTLVISGGGFLGSLWIYTGEGPVRAILEDYKENKIIIFPQSIFFDDNDYGTYEINISKNVYGACKNLSVIFREEISAQRGKAIWGNKIKQYLIPDIALSLNDDGIVSERINERHELKKAGFCVRSDKEGFFNSNQTIQNIKKFFVARGISISDFSMQEEQFIYPKDDYISHIKDKLDVISSLDLVITDALHCVIFCALVHTRCIALPSISGKIEGTCRWLRGLGYIHYVKAPELIDEKLMEELFGEVHRKSFYYTEYEEKVVKIMKDLTGD